MTLHLRNKQQSNTVKKTNKCELALTCNVCVCVFVKQHALLYSITEAVPLQSLRQKQSNVNTVFFI